MKWKLLILTLFLPLFSQAQDTLDRIEYWFDSDIANKQTISILDSQYTFDSSISTSSIGIGLHTFNCRFRQVDTNYSSVITRMFLKLPAGNDTGYKRIVGYEYWVDTACSAKIMDTIAADSSVQLLDGLPLTGLQSGLHSLHIRFKDNSNIWSNVVNSFIVKLPATNDTGYKRVVGYEYWFDTAYSARVTDTLMSDSTLQFIGDLKDTSLSNGLHTLHIRFKDNSNVWSVAQNNFVLINNADGGSYSMNVVTAVRYWVDTFISKMDTTLLNSQAEQAFFFDELNLSNYDTGNHYIYMQFRDAANRWSSVIVDSFFQIGEPKIDDYTPKVGGNIGHITMTIYGGGFINGTSVKLTRTGYGDINASDSLLEIYKGVQIKALFDLKGKDTGLYNLVVTIPNDTVMIITNGFKVETGIYGEIKMSIQGVQDVRIGSNFQFQVIVTNTGNINRRMPIASLHSYNQNPISFDIPLLVENFSVLPIGDIESTIGSGQEITYTIYSKASASGIYGIYQLIDSISNFYYDTLYNLYNDTSSVYYQANLNQLTNCQPPSGQPPTCCPDGCSFPDLPFIGTIGTFLNNPDIFTLACNNHDICYRSSQNYLYGKAKCDIIFINDMRKRCNCNYQPFTSEWSLCIAKAMAIYAGLKNPYSLYKYAQGQIDETCKWPPNPLSSCNEPANCPPHPLVFNKNTQSCYIPNAVGSSDPNEKIGPYELDKVQGYIGNKYPFNYSIYFENDSAATASAQIVKIVDTLNTNMFDLSTFQLGSISVADTTYTIPTGLQEYTGYADYRILGDSFILKIEAGLNDTTGVATWLLTTLDPSTLQPTTSVFTGFLPPNQTSPEGQGSVHFSIQVKDTISNNTVVSNKAYIYFDNNQPIATDQWVNKIDNIDPHSMVDTLPVYTLDTAIQVSWGGTDTSSGIRDYTVYVSKNGGSYKIWKWHTSDTTDTYIGAFDSTYSFYSIALDTAGNIEEAPTTFDTKTTLINCNVKLQPTLDTIGSTTICYNEQVILIANGGNFYDWGNNNNDSLIVTQSGAYTVTVSDTFGCSAELDSTTITVLQLPQITISGTDSICFGDTLALQAAGGNSYLWSPGNDTTSLVEKAPTVNTQYIVQGTGTNGCVNYDTINAVVRTLPNISISGTDSICLYDTLVLTAIGGLTYLWLSGNDTADTIVKTPVNNVQYVLIGTDTNGCVNNDTLNVVVKPLPNISITGIDTICLYDTTTLTATGAASYTWQPDNDTTVAIQKYPSANTQYVVTGTGVNGCINYDSVIVAVKPLPTITISGTDTICFKDTIALTASGGVSYMWSPGNDTSSIINRSPGVNTQYILTGTGFNSCINYDTINIIVNALPSIGISGTDTICLYDTTILSASGGLSYLWLPDNDTTTTISKSPTNNTQYILIGTDANSCVNYDTVSVFVRSLPVVSISGIDTICLYDTTILTASGAFKYTWLPDNDTMPVVEKSPAINTQYIVIGTDSNSCINYDTIDIVVKALPSILITSSADTICLNDTVTLSANGGVSYEWSPGTDTNTIIKRTPASVTQYVLKGIGNNQCINYDTLDVMVNNLPIISIITSTDTICLGDTLMLSVSGANQYLWQHNSDTSAMIDVSPVGTTTFVVTGTDTNACIDIDSTLIYVRTLPQAPTVTWLFGGVLESDYSNNNQWYKDQLIISGAVLQQYTPTTNGSYAVVYTDSYGCKSISQPFNFVLNINESFTDGGFSIYPNPTNNRVTIAGENIVGENVLISVYNVEGKKIINETFKVDKGSFNKEIDLINNPSGYYMVLLQTATERHLFKIVKL